MASTVKVPVKVVNGITWGDLNALSVSHEIVAEEVYTQNPNYSFQGGHRVRKLKLKKNVHWAIPDGMELDISAVPVEPARKQKGGRR